MDTTFRVKQETIEEPTRIVINNVVNSIKKKHQVIDLDSDSDDDDGSSSEGERKRARSDLPAGFLDPLPVKEKEKEKMNDCKQFWKAGDFEDGSGGNWETPPGGMDHVRVHPRFLHSNATSHKWVLGAFAELLDNSLDEVCNGATYANIDMLKNKKDGSRMLVIEDNGGGMDPDKLRQCMSLGYSLKSKVADTIGQYGNGFKTSTMRLGADVIVFTRCSAKNGKRATQSIGLLSYTFLRVTGKEDIVVPMVDYERGGRELKKIIRASRSDWDINIDALVKWSPFSSEADLLKQFDHMSDQGTRIIIYNLWEDDQGQLELDFDADAHDIQIRGVNRDEKNIHMANEYPNSRHFLTYRHSLRSYASILYLRIPPGFRMVLRGKDIQHHNIVNDMMMTTEVTYRPQPGAQGLAKDSNIVAVVTMGFVKDAKAAKAHIDVQGYNVYHKNRLIKPFWRLWRSAGSDGRGVIGVLEANFVEPAHDKQGFERTIVLSRLETRLVEMQKTYWRTNCYKIGYAPRNNKNNLERERSPDFSPETSSKKKKAASSKHPAATVNGFREGPNSPPLTEYIHEDDLHRSMNTGNTNGSSHKGMPADNFPPKYREREWSPDFSPETSSKKKKAASSKHPAATVNGFREGPNSPPLTENIHEDDLHRSMNTGHTNGSSHKGMPADNFPPKYGSHSASPGQHAANGSPYEKTMQMVSSSQSRFAENGGVPLNSSMPNFDQLVEENRILKEKLSRKDEDIVGELLRDLERERKYCKELEAQIEEIKGKSEHMYKEQETIIDIFAEERERRDVEEETLRKKLKEATATIQDLVERVKQLELEKMKTQNGALRKN